MRRALYAALVCLVAGPPAFAQAPSCQTRDLAGAQATSFVAGDELALEGRGFPPDVLVLVTFRQSPRTVELARYRTDAQGAFSSQPRILRIPADAIGGRAAIHLASSGGSATCEVEVAGPTGATASPAAASEEVGEDVNPLIVAWATILALGALVLGYVQLRRWRASRLERQISGLGGGGRGGFRLGDPRDH